MCSEDEVTLTRTTDYCTSELCLYREGHYWAGRDWLWQDSCLCSSNSASTTGHPHTTVCPHPHTNKVTVLQVLEPCICQDDVHACRPLCCDTAKLLCFAPWWLYCALHTLTWPCRELAFQISEQFDALGAAIGVKCGGLYNRPKQSPVDYWDILGWPLSCTFVFQLW